MSGGQKPHRLLRLRNASTRWQSVAVMNPLHAGDAYVSRDTTTARKTACRPISVMPWCRSMRSSDCALSLIIRRICSDADRCLLWLRRGFLAHSHAICRAVVAAVFLLFSAWSLKLDQGQCSNAFGDIQLKVIRCSPCCNVVHLHLLLAHAGVD